MPPRLNKRQQREQEEIAALNANVIHISPDDVVDEATESAEQIERKSIAVAGATKSAFALETEDDEEEEDEEGEGVDGAKPKKKKKAKKKSKKKPATIIGTPTADEPGTQPPQQVSKAQVSIPIISTAAKAEKKGKGKAKAAPKVDDLDAALAELSIKYPDLKAATSTHVSSKTASAFQNFTTNLSVNPKHLDADAEMRKFFGSKVINASSSGTPSSSGRGRRGQQVHATHAAMASGSKSSLSILTKPKPTWPPSALRTGLTLALVSDVDSLPPCATIAQGTGEKWYTISHSNGYKWDQMGFMECVGGLDPNPLFALFRESPWNVDTLLQIGEIYRHQDDYTVFSDFVDRALFAYEKCLSGGFNITSGLCRLDFRKIENRGLFLALHRTIMHLERRGCMRTALEFAKLLWSLDPWTDPHGALLHLDFLVAKGGKPAAEWAFEVEDLWKQLVGDISGQDVSVVPTLECYPGWCWAKVLWLRELRKDKEAENALRAAVEAFPEVLKVLTGLLGISIPDKLPDTEVWTRWDSSNGTISTVHLAAHIYANRSMSLWKIPETSSWLSTTLRSFTLPSSPTLPHSSKQSALNLRLAFIKHLNTSPGAIKSFMRHAIVSDLKPVQPFIAALAGQQQFGFDVVPPLEPGVTVYDEAYFKGAAPENGGSKKKNRTPSRQAQGGVGGVDPVAFLEAVEGVWMWEEMGEGGDARAQGLGMVIAALEQGDALGELQPIEAWVRQNQPILEQFPRAGRWMLSGRRQRAQQLRELRDRLGIQPVEADAAQGQAAAPGAIPGAFGALGGDNANEDEDDEDEENEAPILPVRLARGLMNLIWGGGGANNEEDSSEDEQAPGPPQQQPEGRAPPRPDDVD